MFGHDWEPASGMIVDMKARAMAVNDSPLHEYVIDVTPDSGAPMFRCKVKEPWAGDFDAPITGETVRMLADVKHSEAKFDRSDPQLSWKAHHEHDADSFEASLEAPPGTPS